VSLIILVVYTHKPFFRFPPKDAIAKAIANTMDKDTFLKVHIMWMKVVDVSELLKDEQAANELYNAFVHSMK
jgi:hypothetical protein